MQSTGKVSVQQVGTNTYRVNAKRGRSAVTGRFITQSTAKKAAGSSVTESTRKK